jgi:hypothetical protein
MAAMAAMAAVLWRERECLELLLFKLVQQQLVLSSGHTRWLHLVDDEIRLAAEALREAELIRAAEFDLLARQIGLPADASLRELADVAPDPWPVVLDEHRDRLRALALEIKSVAADNTRLLRAGEHAIRETLDQLRGRAASYDMSGAPTGAGSSAHLLDQQA